MADTTGPGERGGPAAGGGDGDGATASGSRALPYRLDARIASAATVGYWMLVAATLLFLLTPLVIVVVISFQGQAYAGWPPESFTLEWYRSLPEDLAYLGVTEALTNSVKLALATGVVSTTVGGLAAFAVVRHEFRAAATVEALLLSPLIYPWIVVGLALLLFVGQLNSLFGLGVTLSFWTLLAGHVLFTVPYPTRTIAASLQNFPDSVEEAATNLGATELDTYANVTLPLIRPGIISGFVFTFVLSFNQYIISLFLSDSGTQTVPLVLFSLFYNTSPAQLSAIASLLMAGILSLVFLTEYVAGISEFI